MAILITKEEYDKATEGGKVNIPIYGIDVGGGYDAYHQRASEESWRYNSSLTEDESRNLLITYLGGASAHAYETCVENVASKGGLHLLVKSATESSITLYVSWHPRDVMKHSSWSWFGGSTVSEPTEIDVQWTGYDDIKHVLPATLAMGTGRPIVIDRPKEGVTLAVASGGEGSDVTIVPLPKYIPPPPPRAKFARTMTVVDGQNAYFQFTDGESPGVSVKPWSYTFQQAGQVHITAAFDDGNNSVVYQTCTIFLYDTKLKIERTVGQLITPTAPGQRGCIANAQVDVRPNDVVRVQVGIAGSTTGTASNPMTGTFSIDYL